MKRLIKLAVAALLLFGSTSVFAQKFGYINSQEVVFQMPEIDSIQIKLEQLNKDYTDILETMQVELNTKYQEFQKNSSTYSAAIRQVKEKELQELQVRLEEFYGTAQQEISQTRDELFAPVVERARNAIQKVGRENNFFAIIDQSVGAFVYVNEKDLNMVDITPMVKKELGIKDK